jgi:hypothetical protein
MDFNSSMDTSLDSTPVTKKKSEILTPASVKKEEKTPKSVKKVAADIGKKSLAKLETPPAGTPVVATATPKTKKTAEQPTVVAKTPKARGGSAVEKTVEVATPVIPAATPRGGRGEKRKADVESGTESPSKKTARNAAAVPVPSDSPTVAPAADQLVSRSGRLIKPKKFDDDAATVATVTAASSPVRGTETDVEVRSVLSSLCMW